MVPVPISVLQMFFLIWFYFWVSFSKNNNFDLGSNSGYENQTLFQVNQTGNE
jgi:hypothetical protein